MEYGINPTCYTQFCSIATLCEDHLSEFGFGFDYTASSNDTVFGGFFFGMVGEKWVFNSVLLDEAVSRIKLVVF